MQELGAAVFRIYAFCILTASLIPNVISRLSYYTIMARDQLQTILFTAFIPIVIETIILIVMFVYAKPIAQRVLPDLSLPMVAIDLRLATRVALAIAGVALIARSSHAAVPLIASLFESVSNNASNLHAQHRPQWHGREWGALGQAAVGGIFLFLSRRP
ncbi:MAG: hypothetical protein AAF608_09860 [Pseudomonadota bacterium]